VAAKNGHIEIFKLILAKFYDGTLQSKEAYLSRKDLHGRTCLHWACINGFSNIVEYLIKDLKLAFLVDIPDATLNTPLHLSAIHGHLTIAQILLNQDNNTKLTTKNVKNETALLLSCERGHFEIAKLLISRQESIGSDATEKQLIHIATRGGSPEIVKLLLSKGAPISYLNTAGENCLDIALAADQREIITILLQDQNWKQLIETAPKQARKTPKKSIIQLDCMDSEAKSNSGGVDVYTGENPQLYRLFEKKMWDMYLIILDNALGKEASGSYDFEVLDPICESVKRHPLMLVAQSGQETLLTHEAVQKLLYLKWRRIPRLTFYSYLIVYCVFLMVFGLYSMELAEISMEKAKLGQFTNVDRIFEKHESVYFYPVLSIVVVIGWKIFLQIYLVDGMYLIIKK